MKENAEKRKQDKQLNNEIRKQEIEEKVLKKYIKERDKKEGYIRAN